MGTFSNTRRDFLKAVGLGAASLAIPGLACREDGAGKARPPNIIFILADDLGYGDLGCYGQKKIKTPNIDRMAAEGIRFTNHYAGSTVCAPSRSCLMTGQHTGHTTVRGNSGKDGRRVSLRDEDVTVAEVLKQAGYATGGIGKWGLGETGTTGVPNNQGFDYWFGYLNQRHAHNYYPEYLWRNAEKVRLRNVVKPVNPPGGVATKRVEYSHDLFTKEALDFIDRNRQRPFFLYLAYTIPHANNEAGRKGMEVPSLGAYADESWPEPQKGHAAMITRMDSDIGKLMAKLKKLGIDENTLVMFSSDNGPHREGGADPNFFNSSGPLRGIKRDLYEGGIRVPLVARWPGKIKPGSESEHVSAFWDFLPTCAELAGAKPPGDIDGISMVPALLGRPGKQRKHKFLYWEFHERGSRQAVRMGSFKAVRLTPDKPMELYNLAEDVSEKRDVATQNHDVITRIEAYLKTARTESPNWTIESAG